MALVLAGQEATIQGYAITKLNLEEMAARSDVIFAGTCISSKSRWDSQTRMIVTDSVFRVERYAKGRRGATIIVTEAGGVLRERNLAMMYPGMVEFTAGEEVFLFLWTDANRIHHVYGLSQGKYGILKDPVTRVKLVGQKPLEEFFAEVDRIIRVQERR